MELKDSLQYSQKPATGPYRESHDFSVHHNKMFFKIYFSNTLPVVSLDFRFDSTVSALRYKPEGRGFDSRSNDWNFSVT